MEGYYQTFRNCKTVMLRPNRIVDTTPMGSINHMVELESELE